MRQATYPFDPTGISPDNLVSGELHTLTSVNAAPYRIIIPTFAPFYLDNLKLEHVDLTGNRTELTEGVDYYTSLPYVAATRATGKPIYGGLPIINQYAEGSIAITYQTVGGGFTADANYVYARLLEHVYNPRTTWWDNLSNIQDTFPPIAHDQSLDDFTQVNLLFDALNKIADAILAAPSHVPGAYIAHMADQGLHPRSALDLGVSPYAMLPMATDEAVLRQESVDELGREYVVTYRQVLMLLKSKNLIP